MLKKLKCLEAVNSLAREATNNSNSSTNTQKHLNNLAQTTTSVKIIKTEPLDFEMLHLEEKDLRERNLTRDNETTTTITSSSSSSTTTNSNNNMLSSGAPPPPAPQSRPWCPAASWHRWRSSKSGGCAARQR